MECPRCGAIANGAFCASCGSALGSASCRRCGGALPEGARFCTQCGSSVASGRNLPLPLVVIGIGAVLAVGAGAYWLGVRGRETGAPLVGALADAVDASGQTSPGTPPPLTGTMREQADRLFERIMQARARGDDEEVQFFMPMALTAYESVTDLDVDGLFHQGLLLVAAERADEARAIAGRIMEIDPMHLFGHALRAEASLAAGDSAGAAAAFGDYLDAYDVEIASETQEYRVHRPALDEYLTQARAMTRR